MLMTDCAARMCPRCGGFGTVYRSWERIDGVFVRRRRCARCSVQYDTLEIASGYVKKIKSVSIDGQGDTSEL